MKHKLSKHVIAIVTVCLALAFAPQAKAGHALPVLPCSFAFIESTARAAELDDNQFNESETVAEHASRINRNIVVVAGSILTFFIVCRLVLEWQVTNNRRKATFGKAHPERK
jgi:hypothetical protein